LDDKLHDINMINYYFFNKNSCVYECFSNLYVGHPLPLVW